MSRISSQMLEQRPELLDGYPRLLEDTAKRAERHILTPMIRNDGDLPIAPELDVAPLPVDFLKPRSFERADDLA